MKYIGTYGERRAVVAPVPHDTHGTVWTVELDGETWPERYACPDEAREAAEWSVKHAMAWEVARDR